LVGESLPNVYVLDHPYAQMVLTRLRDKSTGQIEFRKGLVKLGRLIGFEIARHLPVSRKFVTTPLEVEAEGVEIPDIDNIVLITVLRAAMPLAEGLLKIFPTARQGVVSARRVEETYTGGMDFEIELTYLRIPRLNGSEIVIIADPMLATGSTMLKVVEEVYKVGKPKRLMFATVISTKQGISRVHTVYPEIEIFTVAIDEKLNERGFIVPGLGDAGDRAFG